MDSMAKKVSRVTFQGKGLVELTQHEPVILDENRIRVKTLVSLISTGTEGICFNRLFAPGTHWDNWVKYPFYTGYCCVCEVTEVGKEVIGWTVGDRAFARISHSSEAVVQAKQLFPIPEDIPNEIAVWSALAMIGSMVLPTGDIRLEDDVAVIGAGPIGQMVLRWCVAAGCRVVIADTVPLRLEMAKKGGAFRTAQCTAAELKPILLDAFGDLPRIVIDTTGIASVFEQALALPRDFGTLVLLGDSGTPAEQRLTSDAIIRGVRIHAGHIMHETKDWHESRIYEKFFDLVQKGRFSVAELNTHIFEPTQCVEAFDLLTNRRAETMGVSFDWQANE
jgi:D-arabinose 1-dehydrogenase-like Zn-dependent alcohol dehydrogenase